MLFLLAACNLPQPPGAAAPTSPPTATLEAPDPTLIASPPPTDAPILASTTEPTPEAAPQSAPPVYTLEVILDYYAHTLAVTETVTYTNNSSSPIPNLVMFVEPNRYASGFALHALTLDGSQAVETYSLSGNRLEIPLSVPLMPGQSLTLTLRFDLSLPAIPEPSDTTKPMPYGYTARQTNLVDWYAFFPPYTPDQGWMWRQPGHFGEHQVYEAAVYQVTISLDLPVLDVVLAASAPAAQDGLTYRYTMPLARNFVWSASQQYQVLSQQVGEVTVYSYYFPYNTTAGEAALWYTAKALETYSQVYGPYPYSTLSVVEADFLDGMEYGGLYFLSRGFYDLYDETPFGYLPIIAAHETAHQWWYGIVGNDQAKEPWLDESLCTFSERVFYENVYPDLQFGAQPVVDWWHYFRIDYYEPDGWVNGSLYDYNGYRRYRNAVYLRGADFLQDLRQQVGDEAFFAFLQDYAVQKAFQTASAEDFFAILEEHTDQDINPLLAEYFQP